MTTPEKDSTSHANEFAKIGAQKRSSLLSEYVFFLKTSKKWWMIPLVLLLLGFGALMLLSSTGAAPFIYTLF